MKSKKTKYPVSKAVITVGAMLSAAVLTGIVSQRGIASTAVPDTRTVIVRRAAVHDDVTTEDQLAADAAAQNDGSTYQYQAYQQPVTSSRGS